MPRTTIPIHPPLAQPRSTSPSTLNNPLPPFLRTPTGLAILELQGTLNIEYPSEDDNDTEEDQEQDQEDQEQIETPIGTISFPSEAFTINPEQQEQNKKKKIPVYLHVGKYQKLRGEVKWLDRPFAVIKKRERNGNGPDGNDGDKEEKEEEEEELEIVEIIRWKILFSGRPEPVS